MQELELIQQQLSELNQKVDTLFMNNIANCINGYAVYDDIPKKLQELNIEQKIKILDSYFNDIDELNKLIQTKG